MGRYLIDGLTPAEHEVKRAKERFNESGKRLPSQVLFRGMIYPTVDCEVYQGLYIVNLDDNGSILRADSVLCINADNLCPTCGK